LTTASIIAEILIDLSKSSIGSCTDLNLHSGSRSGLKCKLRQDCIPALLLYMIISGSEVTMDLKCQSRLRNDSTFFYETSSDFHNSVKTGLGPGVTFQQ